MKVRIYRPSKTAMQSGRAATKTWRIQPELPTPRHPDPLMGWISAGDTLNELSLSFATAEEALRFAQAQGWDVDLEPAHERTVHPRNYADAFKPGRIRA